MNVFLKPGCRNVRLSGPENTIFDLEAPECGSILPVCKIAFAQLPDFSACGEEGFLAFSPAQGRILAGPGEQGDENVVLGVDEIGNEIIAGNHCSMGEDGTLKDWYNPEDRIEWDCRINSPGDYQAEIVTVSHWPGKWHEDREITLFLDHTIILTRRIGPEQIIENSLFPQVLSVLGSFLITVPFSGKISMRAAGSTPNGLISLQLRKL